MSQNVVKVKARIKSVNGAYKVTSAMKLVSTVKLKQWKNKMAENKIYNQQIKEVIDILLASSEKINNPFLKRNIQIDKKLFIILSSTLGLCGSYNSNIFKVADAEISKVDDAIILGQKGLIHFADGEFQILDGFDNVSNLLDYSLLNKLQDYILEEYQKGTYSEIHIIYSEYKNSLVFIARDYCLLPIEKKENNNLDYPPLLEPSQNELIDKLIPFYLKANLFSKLIESNVCEHAARSNAMENATNNAKELLENLKIEFNKARQAAITQEITEIVAASKAI